MYSCQPINAPLLSLFVERISGWLGESLLKVLLKIIISFYRSNRLLLFFKIYVFRNFVIFTEKRLCWSLFLIKLWT